MSLHWKRSLFTWLLLLPLSTLASHAHAVSITDVLNDDALTQELRSQLEAQAPADLITEISALSVNTPIWLSEHLPDAPGLRVLDLGCGNGALLEALGPRIGSGVGVDVSGAMIELASARNAGEDMEFHVVDGPKLPLPDQSVDVVVSLLSFRYLDWDPVMNEIRRVLRPGGRLLVVDMVTAPLTMGEVPRFLLAAGRTLIQQQGDRRFRAALKNLVSDPRWQTMVSYNPIRAQHELVWYLESRFPGRRVEVLNVGRHARVLAFDSGSLEPGSVAPQSYP